ncbi:hypothetical protein Tcan_16330 [Toxocara canis]|uniref:Uncharacterized protein n=1 Tax=Toxocara canis TaxID=6265 RepID=A0A0B2VQZ5_TOXCA|nr:hypothetical protein Tcan_16330 [Toxocara canis]
MRELLNAVAKISKRHEQQESSVDNKKLRNLVRFGVWGMASRVAADVEGAPPESKEIANWLRWIGATRRVADVPVGWPSAEHDAVAG